MNRGGVLAAEAPYRVFAATVARTRRLSPSFQRITFTGPDLVRFADNGYDQRLKLVLPLPGSGLAHLPTGPDWYLRWRELPAERRNPVRTYTVRAVRRPAEVDVDLVRHDDGGPAGRWAAAARPGDEVALIGPDAGWPGPNGGLEFRPPASALEFLLAGDETAVPAIMSILERLPRDARGEAVLEVPDAADAQPVDAPAGLAVRWLPRAAGAPGSRLGPAVRRAAGRLLAVGRHGPVRPRVGSTGAPGTRCRASGSPEPNCTGVTDTPDVSDVDVDHGILWEVPDACRGEAYAWLAGEAGVIRSLRRHLLTERGMDRRCVAFMGYWRLGRAEPTG